MGKTNAIVALVKHVYYKYKFNSLLIDYLLYS
jgi:hypothetical protein